MNKETAGDRIKEKRKSKKMTQKQLCKILNKSESSIQKYESGEVEIPHSVVEEIAKVLDTTVPYLLGYEKGQKQLDELRLFKEQLKLLGCHFEQISLKPLRTLGQLLINYI
ncbi:helix-turn-helix domain-containing protein [Haloimpatiens sp. FM7315]|uniref:helix-turn-helix domain-containing protein n=1 Tax=Haloimpatiens sp. FM7315 TaxID=3298609 RepID=UPI0035A3BDB4